MRICTISKHYTVKMEEWDGAVILLLQLEILISCVGVREIACGSFFNAITLFLHLRKRVYRTRSVSLSDHPLWHTVVLSVLLHDISLRQDGILYLPPDDVLCISGLNWKSIAKHKIACVQIAVVLWWHILSSCFTFIPMSDTDVKNSHIAPFCMSSKTD